MLGYTVLSVWAALLFVLQQVAVHSFQIGVAVERVSSAGSSSSRNSRCSSWGMGDSSSCRAGGGRGTGSCLTCLQASPPGDPSEDSGRSVSSSSRRAFVQAAAKISTSAAAAAAVLSSGVPVAGAFEEPDPLVAPTVVRSPRPLTYRVEFEHPVGLVPENEKKVLNALTKAQVVFLGGHQNGTTDPREKLLEKTIFDKISRRKGKQCSLGLVQVQQQFQGALDAYIAKATPDLNEADKEFERDTEWATRWPGPIEPYLPLLHLAREKGVPLVALTPPSESMGKVLGGGLEGLSGEERNEYVLDFKGFISTVKDEGFKDYTKKVIFENYKADVEAGVFAGPDKDKPATPPTQANYFATRILSDESVASKVVEYVTSHQGSTMVVVQPLDRAKFNYGASGRIGRIAESFGGKLDVKTVALNPTATDTLSANRSLRLSLLAGGNVYKTRVLADYLWFSYSPAVRLLPHLKNEESDLPWDKYNLFELKKFT